MAMRDTEKQGESEPSMQDGKSSESQGKRSTNKIQGELERGRSPVQAMNRGPLLRQRFSSGGMRGRRPSVQVEESLRDRSASGRGSPIRRGRSLERDEKIREGGATNSTEAHGAIVNAATAAKKITPDRPVPQSMASQPRQQ